LKTCRYQIPLHRNYDASSYFRLRFLLFLLFTCMRCHFSILVEIYFATIVLKMSRNSGLYLFVHLYPFCPISTINYLVQKSFSEIFFQKPLALFLPFPQEAMFSSFSSSITPLDMLTSYISGISYII